MVHQPMGGSEGQAEDVRVEAEQIIKIKGASSLDARVNAGAKHQRAPPGWSSPEPFCRRDGRPGEAAHAAAVPWSGTLVTMYSHMTGTVLDALLDRADALANEARRISRPQAGWIADLQHDMVCFTEGKRQRGRERR